MDLFGRNHVSTVNFARFEVPFDYSISVGDEKVVVLIVNQSRRRRRGGGVEGGVGVMGKRKTSSGLTCIATTDAPSFPYS